MVKKRINNTLIFISFVSLLCSQPIDTFGHGGGLDSSGCHHNRKTGDYHCHRGGDASGSSSGGSSRPSQGGLTVIPESAPVEKSEQNIRVVGVTDGDTIKAIIDGREIRIRLYGIDAPESKQAFGQAATTVLKQITTGRTVTAKVMDTDHYGRPVAIIHSDGIDVNEAMVSSGHAWVYQQYCTQSFCQGWKRNEQVARSSGRGLWKENNPTPPWEWRHKVR